jgi:tight adherence protein C
MIAPPTGPTLLGVDVVLVGSILAGIAAAAMVYAVYGVITVRDPMAKRVKALNARREELKAGIIKGSGKKRQSRCAGPRPPTRSRTPWRT